MEGGKGKEPIRSSTPLSGRETPEGSTVASQYSFSSLELDHLPLHVESNQPGLLEHHHLSGNKAGQGAGSGMGMEIDLDMHGGSRKDDADMDGGEWMMGVLPFEMAGEWVETGL